MTLRRVGFFRETESGDITDPSIHDQVRLMAPEYKQGVIRYLGSGHILAVAPTVVHDVLDRTDRRMIGTLCALTDGTWIWPRDCAHYVEKYDIGLPQEFLQHMLANGWKVAANVDLADLMDEGS